MRHFDWMNYRRFQLLIEDGKEDGGGGSLDDAVKKAAEKVEPKKEEKEPEKKDEKKEERSKEELEELAQAKNLLKVLKDPESRKALITTLAEREGLTKDATKKEEKAVAKTIESIIKEHLGEEYEILGGKLTNVIKESLALYTEENVKPVKDGIASREAAELQKVASSAYDKVFSEFKEAKSLENEVAELVKDIKPGKQDPETYFRRLLRIAADEKGVTLTKVSVKEGVIKDFNLEKRNLNRKDASSRLASEGADDSNVKIAPKPMTMDEAIADAAKTAEALLKK